MMCSNCGGRMISKYCREGDAYTVRTRHCKNCKKVMHTVEISKEEYNKSVDVLNRIVDMLKE
jgi:hypothetical protein